MNSVIACGKEYRIIKLLGHGKGGYSYLAEADAGQAVVKQIHHEPCDYYAFGNKIEAEKTDYERLRKAGIRIPALIAIDEEAEIVVKEYIAGGLSFDPNTVCHHHEHEHGEGHECGHHEGGCGKHGCR